MFLVHYNCVSWTLTRGFHFFRTCFNLALGVCFFDNVRFLFS